MTHAKFGSPSTLFRSEACPGWVAYTKDMQVDEAPPSEHALEGTEFHHCMEQAMMIWASKQDAAWDDIQALTKDSKWEEMDHYVLSTTKEMIKKITQFRKTHVTTTVKYEQRVNLTKDIFGTADFIIYGTNKRSGKTDIVVIDYKYGKGVRVNAHENLQGLAYLCASIKTLKLKNIGHALFVIAQVRLDDGWTDVVYTMDELEIWQSKIIHIVDKVKNIYNGKESLDGNLHAGSHCRWCVADGNCIAQKAATYDLVEKTATELDINTLSKHLTLDQQVDILLKKKRIEEFLDAIAMNVQKTLQSGVTHPLVKIIQTKGRRAWDKSVKAEDLEELGVVEPYNMKLKGITDVEREIGKGKIDHLTVIGEGKIEVVPTSDTRPGIVATEARELAIE